MPELGPELGLEPGIPELGRSAFYSIFDWFQWLVGKNPWKLDYLDFEHDLNLKTSYSCILNRKLLSKSVKAEIPLRFWILELTK